ncbi:MAG: hypothetical protein OEL89_00620 [Candidatus Peregrinibacteria bacterium]|nr:hypothetical protein [Candidatus Peregrinibacteria bacterium]
MSIFNIPSSFKEIERPNKGIKNSYYQEVTPTIGNITVDGSSNNFTGELNYKFEYDELHAYVPEKSFMLFRGSIAGSAATTALTQGDNIAITLNPLGNIFSKESVFINDKPIKVIQDYRPQRDILDKRQTYSGEKMNSEQDLTYLQASFQDRLAKTTGFDNDQFIIYPAASLGYTSDMTAAITVTTGAIAFATGSVDEGIAAANPIKLGDILVLKTAAGDTPASTYIESTITERTNSTTMKGDYVVAVTAGLDWYIKRPKVIQAGVAQYKREIIYKSSHPFLKIDKAIPMCKVELKYTPLANGSWQKSLLQSLAVAKTSGYTVYIEKLSYMAYMIEFPQPYRIERGIFEMDSIDVAVRAIASGTQQFQVDVHQRTNGITLAVQDTNASTISTLYPQSVLKIVTGYETNITDMKVKYAGKIKPEYLTDFQYTTTVDFLKMTYWKTFDNLGFYANNIIPENYTEWITRGPFWYFPFDKDPSDSSSVATINLTHTCGSHNLLVFCHYKDFVIFEFDKSMGRYQIKLPFV